MSKTYLIIGATSPLGLALMGRLLPALEEGDLILAQGCGDLARLAGLCQARPGFIRPYDADFTQPLAVRAFLSDLTDTYPAPTHFVHLAGLRPIETPCAHFDEERFVQERAVTLDSALVLGKAILPKMAQAGFGRVVVRGSRASARAVSANILQGALNGLALSLAAEYASAGVTVNCIAPGVIDTAMNARLSGEERRALEAEIPMERFGTPEEVAAAVLFLARAKDIPARALGVVGGVWV